MRVGAGCAIQHGYRYVIFGHTHLAKKVAIENDAFYLNSGTWADVMQFPKEILTSSEGLDKLKQFYELLSVGNFSSWILFRPTYIRLDLNASERVVQAELLKYEKPELV